MCVNCSHLSLCSRIFPLSCTIFMVNKVHSIIRLNSTFPACTKSNINPHVSFSLIKKHSKQFDSYHRAMGPIHRHHLGLVCRQLVQLVFDTGIVDFLAKRHAIADFARLRNASNVHCLVVATTLYVCYDLRMKLFYLNICSSNTVQCNV